MSPKLPKATDKNQTGRMGVTVLQERLEREGWIFRRQEGTQTSGSTGRSRSSTTIWSPAG